MEPSKHRLRWHRSLLRTFCLLVLLPFLACVETTSPRFHSNQRSIINGSPDLRFPAVGVLVRDRTPFCTATLITPRLVLTAGHCIDLARVAAMGQNALEFRIDTPRKDEPAAFDSVYFAAAPSLLHTHPLWNPERLLRGYDVGLVVLRTAVPKSVATPLPVRTSPLPQVSSLLFQGYGLVQSVGHPVSPNRKLSATIPIVRIERDRVASEAPGKSICHGDSGGPALLLQDGKATVVAVNSYGETAGVPDSKPYRSRCDGRAVSIRTDAVASYLLLWMSRLGGDGRACQQTSDCPGCQRCQQGRCVTSYPALLPNVCKPCRQDADCGNDGVCTKTGGVFRCAQRCSQGCCPPGQRCLPSAAGASCSKPACSPAKCQTDSDCGTGETCTQGTCALLTSARSATLCHPCNQHSDCGQKGLCAGRQVGGHCLQACSAKGACPEGFFCKTVRPGFPRQCVSATDRCTSTCDANRPCPGGFSCKESVCVRSSGGEVGDDCDLTSCQAGLWCVSTVLGKRCLQACHLSAGRAGGACRSNNTCAAGSACIPFRGLRRKFCLSTCKAATDCPLGGTCESGYCYCSTDLDCKAGNVCEKGFGNTSSGFCVNPNQLRACPAGFQCRFHVQGSFCFPTRAKEERNIGLPCNDRVSCHGDLNCLELRNHAGICSENCRDNAVCKLGGTCFQGECLCSGADDCPQGRQCRLFVYLAGRQRGVCVVNPDQGKAARCVTDTECGLGYRCEGGICQQGERTPEPAQEPNRDGGGEVAKEPLVRERSPQEREVSSELGDGGSSLERRRTEQRPEDGCTCDASTSLPGPAPLLLWLVFLWKRRKRKNQELEAGG